MSVFEPGQTARPRDTKEAFVAEADETCTGVTPIPFTQEQIKRFITNTHERHKKMAERIATAGGVVDRLRQQPELFARLKERKALSAKVIAAVEGTTPGKD